MVVVRPAHETDLDAVVNLAAEATAGITTLPCDREVLRRRVAQSCRSFEVMPDRPQGEVYQFILEDIAAKRVVGTCGMVSKVGGFEPFYAYRVVTRVHESLMLNVRKEIQELQLVREHNGPCEIGSLFLTAPYRRGGHGRLLSLSRFLFLAEHPQAFETVVIAEMRGVIDRAGHSPFWEALGRHFFDVELPEADHLSMVNKRFIAELLPTQPIFIPLLPREAQEVIGHVHEETRPALKLLRDEGFRQTNMVDIFDGGPLVSCRLPEIRTVRESRRATVAAIHEDLPDAETFLVSNARPDFRAGRSAVQELADGTVRLPRETASALEVVVGDTVRIVSPRPKGAEGASQ
ncbi:MAG: arginine N-succinyltransferase [Candidatus Hydrogenedentes bacterium]|nr:arginine N-succinyltransferase [Candidatus Hydrogenedentota bacterium]